MNLNSCMSLHHTTQQNPAQAMRITRWLVHLVLAAACFAVAAGALSAQQVPPELYSKLQWRLIGPFRAGRVTCVTGIPGNTALYYAGTPGGGIWKTTDSGQVWTPIFDDARVASIGAIAVATTNPSIIYVGTGEQTPGNGMWKSTDAGATWKHIGLDKTHFISTVLVDQGDPNLVLVAALGDRASGDERGVYRSADGGATWKKVLYRDETWGVIDMTFDPRAPQIVFASFQRRANPGGGAGGRGRGGATDTPPEPDIYKSTDEGQTWQPLNSAGLPPTNLGRIGIAVAPGSAGRRVYAIVNQGFFRSDDAGATWTQTTKDPRIVSSGYFGKTFVNPSNPEDVFIGQTSMYRSTNGGRSWDAFAGAPSGADYHVIWINPENPRYMIQGVDQGAVVSENGGLTWSSWNNQPTGQLYHVSTDNQYPYNVYAAQQDSGTVGLPSRSSFGFITDAERISVAGFEAAYISVDPLNPNYIYSNSWYGSVIRFDRVTGQFVTVFVRPDKYRVASMAPLVFSPQDPHTLYLGTQFVLKTTDGGMTWKEISPDLTVNAAAPNAVAPPAGGFARGGRGGALNTLAVSSFKGGVLWSGSTNGRIQLTQDGGANWKDVTSPDFPSAALPNGALLPAAVQIIDASHFDAATAYAAISSPPTADPAPYIFRTHDGGATWQKIVTGLPADIFVRFVREDTKRKGLLFAGTETSVWVSFDDGDHWESLQQNLPVTSMRDLEVHGDDLVLATYGRSIYILDDIAMLRDPDLSSLASKASGSAGEVVLFPPANAVRTRWDVFQDTPLQRETAAGANPPDGAIFDYYLKSVPLREFTLDILDSKGSPVRHYSSKDLALNPLLPNIPEYWFAPPAVLSKTAGPQRFVWDLRYADPDVLPYSFYGDILDYVEYTLADHAIPGETPRVQPQGPLAAPGKYTAVLTANGRTARQSFTVAMDPRVHATQADLEEQLAWALKTTRALTTSTNAYNQDSDLIAAITARMATANLAPDLSAALKKLAGDATTVQNGAQAAQGVPVRPGVGPTNRELARVYWMIESGDSRPSETAKAAVQELCDALDKGLDAWRALNAQTIPALNAQLAAQKLAPLPVINNVPAGPSCGK